MLNLLSTSLCHMIPVLINGLIVLIKRVDTTKVVQKTLDQKYFWTKK